jgi:ribosomal protein L32
VQPKQQGQHKKGYPQRKRSPTKQEADHSGSKKKLLSKAPHCFFCGVHNQRHRLDAVHLIRKSWSIALQDNPKNIVLGCRRCHEVFDDKPEIRDMLGNMGEVKDRVRQMDAQYYHINFGI